MKLQFNDKVYDILKWLCLIALPALSVLYSALAGVWGWPYAQEVATTINAVVAFVGALIGMRVFHHKTKHRLFAISAPIAPSMVSTTSPVMSGDFFSTSWVST